MEPQRYETPEEALIDHQESEQESAQESHKETFLDRYKHFPWWVKYGPLIAIIAVFLMPQLTELEILSFTLRTQDMVLAGLISVLVSTVGYRFFEHKSQFVHENAQWLFYAGLILIVVPLIIAFFSPPLEAIDPAIVPEDP